MASSALSGLSRVAKEVGKFFKPPWKITGPVVASDFLESVSQAGTYRPIAPASQTLRVLVPQAEPDNVYRIAYHTRDNRRADVPRSLEHFPSEGAEVAAAAAPDSEAPAENAEKVTEELPPVAGKYYVMGQSYHINDAPGDGYQR